MKLKNNGKILTVKLKTNPTPEDFMGHWIAIGPGQTIEVQDDLNWKKQFRHLCNIHPKFEIDALVEVKEPIKVEEKVEVEAEEPKPEKKEKKKRKKKGLF